MAKAQLTEVNLRKSEDFTEMLMHEPVFGALRGVGGGVCVCVERLPPS